eukprot:jgi/Chlat1/137/Chrsp1S03229
MSVDDACAPVALASPTFQRTPVLAHQPLVNPFQRLKSYQVLPSPPAPSISWTKALQWSAADQRTSICPTSLQTPFAAGASRCWSNWNTAAGRTRHSRAVQTDAKHCIPRTALHLYAVQKDFALVGSIIQNIRFCYWVGLLPE